VPLAARDKIADDALVDALTDTASERGLQIATVVVSHLFVTHHVLTSAMELSLRTGIPVARLFESKHMSLVNMMMLKLAIDNNCVPIPSHQQRQPSGTTTDGGSAGGKVLAAVCGVHEDGPFAELDFASAYPSTIIAHELCWHNPPLLPGAMAELRDARRAATNAGTKTALKLLANSIYGCLHNANTTGSRFVLDDAQSVGRRCAALGRDALQRAVAVAAERGVDVLYGVTDSMLIRADREIAIHLADAISTEHLRMAVKATYDRVVVLNNTNFIGTDRNKIITTHKGVVDWNDCAWLKRHLLDTLAKNADIASAVARARTELLDNRGSHAWCAYELVRFGSSKAERVPLIGATKHAGDALRAAVPIDDGDIEWYVAALSKKLHSRRKLRNEGTPMPRVTAIETSTGVATGRTGRVQFGAIAAARAGEAAMPEAPKLIDIEDLRIDGPLPLCIRQHIHAPYPSDHSDQMLFFRGLRGLGFSHATVERFMLVQSPSHDKHRDRVKKLHGFEKVTQMAYKASLDGYKKHQVSDAGARDRASCYPNCKTQIRDLTCPYTAERSTLVATLRNVGHADSAIAEIAELAERKKLYKEACAHDLRSQAQREIVVSPPDHARDYVQAAMVARQMASMRKRKSEVEVVEDEEDEEATATAAAVDEDEADLDTDDEDDVDGDDDIEDDDE
jgi:hypothetical protein